MSSLQGFPNRVDLWQEDNLDKMAKNCIKILKSKFWWQRSGVNMGDKPDFWVVGWDGWDLSPTKGNPALYDMIDSWFLNTIKRFFV